MYHVTNELIELIEISPFLSHSQIVPGSLQLLAYNAHNATTTQQELNSLAVSLKSCKTVVKKIYEPLRIFTQFRPHFVSTVKKRREKIK